jgi:proline iminopeptidase
MASIPTYNSYAADVLMPQMDQSKLAEIKRLEATGQTADPAYMKLLLEEHYVHHVLRMPYEQWPDPVLRLFKHLNESVYVSMQGPSELGASGKLLNWDRSADLSRIDVPALVIGAEHDTMDPSYLRWMAEAMPQGSYWHCPNGSHCAQYDDQTTYMQGLIEFLTGRR